MGAITFFRRHFIVPAFMKQLDKALGLKKGFLMNFLKGKLTYITTIGSFLLALAGFLDGKLSATEFMAAVSALLALFGVRRSIGAVQKSLDDQK